MRACPGELRERGARLPYFSNVSVSLDESYKYTVCTFSTIMIALGATQPRSAARAEERASGGGGGESLIKFLRKREIAPWRLAIDLIII